MHLESALRRWLLPALAAALLAVSALSLHTAGAQGASENPNLHQRPLRDGEPVDEYMIEAKNLTTYTQVELYMGAGSDRTRVTYQDFGKAEFWFDQRPSGGNVPNGGNHVFRLNDDGTIGAQVSECSGGASQRCSLTKAEWQTLAGQTGAADSAIVRPIRIAFNLPASLTANTIRIGVVHYTQDAVRPGSGTRWGPNVDWAVVTYGAIFVPVDDDDNPLYFRNSFSQDASATTDLQYMFAAGQLSQIRLLAGVSRSTAESSDSAYRLTYGDFDGVWLSFWEPGNSAFATTGNAGFHQQMFFTPDGEPFPPCADDAAEEQCRITSEEWKAAAGMPNASDDDVARPIRLAIKPPLENPGGGDWNGATLRVQATVDQPGSLNVETRSVDFARLSAHISRMQSGAQGVGAVDPANNDDVADDMHIATSCEQGVHTTGGSAPTMDCTRAVEVGESIYVENILRRGGTDTSHNDGRTSSTGTLPNTRGSWLRADAARPGVFYDRIEVAASVGGNPGGGIVSAGTLCPIDAPADPPHPDETAIIPRDRTAAALAKCVYGDPVKSGTYWPGTGPTFVPTVSSGTVMLTLSYYKGEDDPATTGVDESLVARDTLAIPIAGATDNTDTGNGGSDWDESELIAQLGSRSFDDSLSLLIGHRRNRGIPEFWAGLSSPTGPGSIRGATYASVDADEAVVLTVPAGGGLLELLGTTKSCDSADAACTLTITRADLKAAARYGVPAASRSGAIADAAPYWPAALRFTHADPPGDVKISGVLTRADASTHEFSYTAEGGPVDHGTVVAAYLPADADARLAPGQTTMLAVGYRVPETSSAGGTWRAFNPTPAFYGIESYRTNVPQIGIIDMPARALPSAADGTYLQLSGPATWTNTGGRRLQLDIDGYGYFKCVAAASLTGVSTDEGRICYVTDAAGDAPSITAAADAAADVSVTANLPLWTLFGAEEPTSADGGGGQTRSRDAHFRQRFEAFGVGTVRVASVSQLTSITLGRTPAADGSVPTAPIRINGSGSVRLALLNENGAPSQISAVSAITITVIGGGTLSGFGCSGVSSCTLEGDTGALFEAAGDSAGVTARIDLTYKAPAQPGTASIEATVVGVDGSTFTETLALVVSGSAAEIASSGDMPRVHSSATEDDDRDEIKIPINASDANGNAARMPSNAAALVRGIDGTIVSAGRVTSEVKCTDEARLKCSVEIAVTAPAGSPLDSGAYTATVTGSGIGSSEVGFAVAGPAETVSIRIPDQLPGLGQAFTATASVVDKAGVPVADGTWVRFEANGRGAIAASAILAAPPEAEVDHDGDAETPAVLQRRAPTKNGEAGAAVVVVGEGISVLTATAGGKSVSEPLDTRGTAPAEAPAGPVIEYGTPDRQPAASSWATYRGASAISAPDLLDHERAPANASVVWLWNGVEWIRYGESDGAEVPGSRRFTVTANDVVWFGE